MKQKYEAPETEVLVLAMEHVIAASGTNSVNDIKNGGDLDDYLSE